MSAILDKRPDAKVLYVASRSKLDEELLKEAGIPFRPIFSGKWRRYFAWRNFIDPFFVLIGFLQSLVILSRFRPHVVFSKGGFVSLPVVLAAFLFRRKIILHESDSRMGVANRIAARLADKVCVAFPNLLKNSPKYCMTGNPIRPEIAMGDKKEGYRLTGFRKGLPVLLVWGGSQGAAEINQMIEKDFRKFTREFQIVHITGKSKEINKKSLHYISFDYLGETLKHIYAITDMAIGRAGANSLYELAYLQKPNIIIPLKNTDQLGNARYFEEKGAGIVYKKEESDNGRKELFDLVHDLWQNRALQKAMRQSLGEITKTDANGKLVKLILDL